MNNSELFLSGVRLMVFGMGLVFVFLVLMIFAMRLLERVLRPFVARLAAAEAAAKPAPKTAGGPDDRMLAAAAVAAVELERAKK